MVLAEGLVDLAVALEDPGGPGEALVVQADLGAVQDLAGAQALVLAQGLGAVRVA